MAPLDDLVIIISSRGYKGWVFPDPQLEPDAEVHN
jgi:hypothetical protein